MAHGLQNQSEMKQFLKRCLLGATAGVYILVSGQQTWAIDCSRLLRSFSEAISQKSIDLPDGQKIPVHTGLDGRNYVYLFPFLRTEIEFVDSEPYVTVYRGVRGRINPKKASGTLSDHYFGDELEAEGQAMEGNFGDSIFTTLNPKVAVGYLTRVISFSTPKYLTLMRLRLPLKKAYVAKRPKNVDGGISDKDQFIPALANKNFIWFKWRARDRLRERELVWNLQELGGDLSNPIFQLSIIEVPVLPDSNGNYISLENWYAAQSEIQRKLEAGSWAVKDHRN